MKPLFTVKGLRRLTRFQEFDASDTADMHSTEPEFPGFIVENWRNLPPPQQLHLSDEADEQPLFNFRALVLNLSSIEKIQKVLGLDEASIVDCAPARYYLENEVESSEHPGEDIDTDDFVWPFERTALDFSLPSTDVRRRGAWAWWRSANLCEKQADAVQHGEVSVGCLPDGEQTRQIMVDSLRARARKAMEFAKSLDPKLATEGAARIPDWADAWTDEDDEYYEEMMVNHKMQQYATAIEKYKKAAKRYILEAIYTYLRDKHYVEIGITKETPKSVGQLLVEAICCVGSVARLWSQAAEWSVTNGQLPLRLQYMEALVIEYGGTYSKPRDSRDDFREWWQRAALAMGHSVCLDEELTKIRLGLEKRWLRRQREPLSVDVPENWAEVEEQSEGLLRRWNDFRMQSPPSIEDYENDSDVRGSRHVWMEAYGGTEFKMDYPYMSLYNCMYADNNDRLSQQRGEEPTCFVYGCPDIIFAERGKSGWTAEYLGLLHGCTDPKEALYERYQRKGLLDWIPGSSEYEKLLAICADDIATRIDQEGPLLMAFLEMCEKAGVSSEEFSSLKRELKLMVTRRAVMTHATAKQLGFTELVYSVITAFIERLTNSSYVQDMDVSAPALIPRLRIALIYLEHSLNDIIKPYLGVEFRILPNGHPFTFISPNGHFDSTLRSIYTASKSLSQYAEWVHAALLDSRIEQLKAKMKNTGEISPSDMSFARQFKETLVSGNSTMLPKVATGLFEHRQRDLTRSVVQEKHRSECPPNKICQQGAGNESADEKDRNKTPSPEESELTEEEKELCERFMRLLG